MSLSGLFVQALNGLAAASTLFLLASGLSLIFGVTRIVNFAHGSFYMLGAYVAWSLTDRLQGAIGFWFSILAGAAVCWHFELLPRWAIALLALREVTTLALSYYGLKHGADIEITWVGRIAVFLIMGGIFWSMVLDWTIIRIGFSVGVILSIVATVLYVREARRHVQTSVQPSRSD